MGGVEISGSVVLGIIVVSDVSRGSLQPVQ